MIDLGGFTITTSEQIQIIAIVVIYSVVVVLCKGEEPPGRQRPAERTRPHHGGGTIPFKTDTAVSPQLHCGNGCRGAVFVLEQNSGFLNEERAIRANLQMGRIPSRCGAALLHPPAPAGRACQNRLRSFLRSKR